MNVSDKYILTHDLILMMFRQKKSWLEEMLDILKGFPFCDGHKCYGT